MRSILLGLAAIIFVGAFVVFFGPLLISTGELRDSLFAQIESATGYRLRVSGPIEVSLFPSFELVAEDVGVAQGGDQGELATAKSLRLGLTLSALFGGKVRLGDVTLIDPLITLPESQTTETSKKATGANSAADSAVATLRTLSLEKLAVKNGTLILPPSGGKPGKRIDALTLEASLPENDGPFTFALEAIVDGETIAASGSLTKFRSFLDGAAASLTAEISAPSRIADKVLLDGTASYKGGTFTLSRFSARAGEKTLSGSANYKGTLLTLHPFALAAKGNRLSGSVVADLGGAVPAVNVAVNAETLDLNAMSAKQPTTAPVSGVDGEGGGWSNAPIDFSPLKAVTAKLKLSARTLVYGNVKIDDAVLQATVAGGRLEAQLPNFKLYGGAGSAALTVDASGKAPVQKVQLSLANFDAYPFLRDSVGFQNIEGTGQIALDLSASGASQRAIVSALNGTAKVEFADGAIRGINIAKAMRNLSSGVLSGWQESAAEKTDFAAFGANFKIAKGQAQTADLKLIGPLVRMKGAGTVNLPAQALKFRVDPQVVASLEGQGGKADLQGLGVPIMIAGPWGRPSIYPDIEGILQDPVAAYEQLNKIGGGLIALPAAATGSLSEVGQAVKKGKIAPDALGQGTVEGLGQILGTEQQPVSQASPAPETGEQPAGETVAPPKKKNKKRQANAAAKPDPAAKQALETLFGN